MNEKQTISNEQSGQNILSQTQHGTDQSELTLEELTDIFLENYRI